MQSRCKEGNRHLSDLFNRASRKDYLCRKVCKASEQSMHWRYSRNTYRTLHASDLKARVPFVPKSEQARCTYRYTCTYSTLTQKTIKQRRIRKRKYTVVMPRDREKGFPPRRPCMSLCSAACGHKPEAIPRKNQAPKKRSYLYTLLLLRVYPFSSTSTSSYR